MVKRRMEKNIDLDRYAKELQEQILKQVAQRYSKAVIELWQNPINFRRMESPDGYASVRGQCGDTMEMFIKMKDERISECTFNTDGCGTTIACGGAATELAINKTFTEALAGVGDEAILKKLGGLPEEDVHCAQLAAGTLRKALADLLYKKQTPWKKHYRKF